MNVFATYNLKGGVGKTAAAINLAYLSAQSGFRTLVWDLDPQGAATFYLRGRAKIKGGAEQLLEKKNSLSKIVRNTEFDKLDLVPADFSLRNLDLELAETKQPERRLKKLLRAVKHDYDVVVLDCAPTISLTSLNIIAMSNWLIVPLIPTHLSIRAYEQLQEFFASNDLAPDKLLPYFSMVDKRKRLHRDLIVSFVGQHPELLHAYIPYLSQIEMMGEHRAPVGAFAPNGVGARAFDGLWQAIMQRTVLAPQS